MSLPLFSCSWVSFGRLLSFTAQHFLLIAVFPLTMVVVLAVGSRKSLEMFLWTPNSPASIEVFWFCRGEGKFFSSIFQDNSNNFLSSHQSICSHVLQDLHKNKAQTQQVNEWLNNRYMVTTQYFGPLYVLILVSNLDINILQVTKKFSE